MYWYAYLTPDSILIRASQQLDIIWVLNNCKNKVEIGELGLPNDLNQL